MKLYSIQGDIREIEDQPSNASLYTIKRVTEYSEDRQPTIAIKLAKDKESGYFFPMHGKSIINSFLADMKVTKVSELEKKTVMAVEDRSPEATRTSKILGLCI